MGICEGAVSPRACGLAIAGPSARSVLAVVMAAAAWPAQPWHAPAAWLVVCTSTSLAWATMPHRPAEVPRAEGPARHLGRPHLRLAVVPHARRVVEAVMGLCAGAGDGDGGVADAGACVCVGCAVRPVITIDCRFACCMCVGRTCLCWGVCGTSRWCGVVPAAWLQAVGAGQCWLGHAH